MPLIWSQLVKCVLITAKVWMNMSRTKDRALQPHRLTIKRDLPQLDVSHAEPPKDSCVGGIAEDASTSSELIPQFKAFILSHLCTLNFFTKLLRCVLIKASSETQTSPHRSPLNKKVIEE